MSHHREREENNCLNCNAAIQGKYCHFCGQENIETRESAWHLISHFFQDFTHFDGKLFGTLKYLVRRPGFLSREYMNGRRASYLNPVRMYVFSSAFFFLVFFSFFNTGKSKFSGTTINGKSLPEIAKMDSASFADFTRNINLGDNRPDLPMTRKAFDRYVDSSLKRVFDSTLNKSGLVVFGRNYKTRAAYDSALLSGTETDNWLLQQIVYQVIDLNKKYKNNAGEVIAAFRSTLLHSLPQMLFISLPLLALLLQLLYYRHKQFLFVNHAIFSIQLYIFVFISMLLLFGLNRLNEQLHWGAITILSAMIYFGLFFYEYKAMRYFYGQRRAKTIFKFMLLNLVFFFMILILFTVFIFFSLFKI